MTRMFISQRKISISFISVGVVWIAIAFQGLTLSWSLFFIGSILSGLLGTLVYIKIVLQISPKITADHCHGGSRIESTTKTSMQSSGGDAEINQNAPIFSRNIDKEVNDVIDKIWEKYFLSWLLPLLRTAEASDQVKDIIVKDIWTALGRLNDRMTEVDKVRLLSNDLVQKLTQHFSSIRLASAQAIVSNSADEAAIHFSVHSFLLDDKLEDQFLEKISQLLILFLLPANYGTCVGTRTLRHILTKKVFRQAIDYVTNPSNINQWILDWLQQAEDISERDGHHADIAALKQRRLNILTEIVQATTMDNVGDGNLEQEKKMRDYITSLVRAKAECEDKLKELGDEHFKTKMSQSLDSIDTIDSFIAVRKNLSFAAIMNSPFSRRYFYIFLEQLHMQDLLGFWGAVEELKESDKKNWHQLATEIFYTFINKPSKVIRVGRSSLKQMEVFLMGDSEGIEVFSELQRTAREDLESNYYPAFLISELCYKLLEDAHDNDIVIEEPADGPKPEPTESSLKTKDNHGVAKSHLEQVNEKLTNKVQALRALQGCLKSDSKVLKMLQGQIETLQKNKMEVEEHLQRTEAWTEYLGEWRVHVQSVLEEEDALKVTLIVHVPIKNELQSTQPSWICSRNVSDFHLLHKELMPYFAWVKDLGLPSANGSGLLNFRSSQTSVGSQNKAEKARSVLQRYMDAILTDDRLNQSEIVYSFLSPSPAYLTRNKKTGESYSSTEEVKFLSLPRIFKSNPTDKSKADQEEDLTKKRLLFLDGRGSKVQGSGENDVLADVDARDLGHSGDGVTENFLSLISEVFDMRGVSKILRKSLMTFVQITYGSTINRQVKDTASWITSEHMVIRYIKTVKETLWPSSDVTEGKEPTMSADEVRRKARESLIRNIPDWLSHLVGQQSSKAGITKVFDAFQEKTLNKLLLYDLVEILMHNLFPELVRSYAFQQFRTISI